MQRRVIMSSRSLASSVASGGDASIDERPPNRRLHRGLGSFLSASMLSMASGDLSTPIAEGDEDGSSSDDEDVMGEPQTEAGASPARAGCCTSRWARTVNCASCRAAVAALFAAARLPRCVSAAVSVPQHC